jgi:hypothetical protein
MRRQDFIDGYDWKARYIPTVILLAPLLCTAYYFYPGVLANPLRLAGSSLLAFALVYLASMVFRDRGVRYARRFWDGRGGIPSTRFGRMSDSFLSPAQKNRLHVVVLNRFGIRLLSLEEECEFAALADRKIMDAFREIKEFLRRCDGCGLVEKHGAEYGFVRNLCGSRTIFVVQTFGGILLCGFKASWPHWTLTPGCWANAVLLILWVPFAWFTLPRMLVLTADAYAGRAWITFLCVIQETIRKPSTSVMVGDVEQPSDASELGWLTHSARSKI